MKEYKNEFRIFVLLSIILAIQIIINNSHFHTLAVACIIIFADLTQTKGRISLLYFLTVAIFLTAFFEIGSDPFEIFAVVCIFLALSYIVTWLMFGRKGTT